MTISPGGALSAGGCTLFALPSRNREGKPNIVPSVEGMPNLLGMRESVDMVVTEYGVATLKGRSLRERAKALIDIAHPDDRQSLMEEAKALNVINTDQIFLPECAARFPAEIGERHTFKGGLEVRFRHIRPSGEEDMRRLFYRFSPRRGILPLLSAPSRPCRTPRCRSSSTWTATGPPPSWA